MTFSAIRFESEEELEDYAGSNDYDTDTLPGLCAGIVVSGFGNDYKVRLRYDDNHMLEGSDKKQQVPTTKKLLIDPLEQRPYKEAYEMYHKSGFTFLQYLVIKALGGTSINNLKVGLIPMKTHEYVDDEFIDASSAVGIIVILAYLAPIFKIVSMIVQDKESKTREGMKIMGLKDTAYWASFFAYYFVILTIIGILLAVLAGLVVLRHINFALVFLFFLLYGLAVLSFGFFLSTLFHRARIAGISAAMIYVCLYTVSNFILNEEVSTNMGEGTKRALSLFPTVAANLACSIMVKYESGKKDLSFDNINDVVNNFRFSGALIMLGVDIAMYCLLGLYLDNVIPSPTGARKPLHFFLTKSFWSPGNSAEQKKVEGDANSKLLYPDGHFEKVGEELKAQEEADECMKIRYLNKYFGDKRSVADFSLNLYKGQIFALLGPNGAGKTTTISMLTGLLPPTSGEATFSKMEIFKDMSALRSMLGVCPQHDVLFEMLTPREHLEIFAAFKGRASMKREIKEILEDIELGGCIDTAAGKLSGGQRRKLSIGIAFVGNSDIIFLDEPTSGIDINSRKGVWAMLKKHKQDKIIILTTHYMEEAEELGDRIGIMTHGTLKCVGSPLFLKTVYGAGYNLTVVCDEVPKEEQSAVREKITKHLRSLVKDISIRKATAKEIVYFLPKNQAKDLKDLFVDLDKNLRSLRIQTYGIATNTLEEIFLQVADEDEAAVGNKQKYAIAMPSENITESDKDTELDMYSIMNESDSSCFSSFFVHFAAIMIKRTYISMRNWGTLIVEIIVPVLIVLLGLLMTKIHLYYDSDPRWFDSDIYGPQSIVINTQDSSAVSTNSFIQYLDFGTSSQSIRFANTADGDALKSMEGLLYESESGYGSVLVNKLDTTNKNFEYIVMANLGIQDSVVAFMGYFGQTLLRLAKNDADYKLTFANAPLPITYSAKGREQAKNGDIVSSMVVVAFALIPSNVISFIVQEREMNLKHQQVITGVSLTAYWMSNCVMDTLRSLLPCSISIGLIYIADVTLPYSWLLMLLYTFTIIPFTYFTSFLFDKENVAQTATLLFHFFMGVVVSVVTSILRTFDSTRSAGKVVAWIFKVVPSFALADGISVICSKDLYAALENKTPEGDLSYSVAGGNALFLCILFPFSILMIILCESRLFSCLAACCKPFKVMNGQPPAEKDQLVLKEEAYCENVSLVNNPPAVLARHLNKTYKISSKKTMMAVDDVSFGVNIGECMALLGTSGAGKSTTFKILTGDLLPTGGNVFINGKELNRNFSDIRRTIGYGPQYESAYMSMTVRENLEFYAMLKGIPKSIRAKAIDKLIADMDLIEFENILVGNLSGGNKRKTTVAIALLGNPPIVFLDEPSTGVDPQAKRFMWQVIQRVSTQSKNTAVILTTHSMEEAEALCTKMAIMTGGNFCCIGSPQELKGAFGKGYEIQISIPSPTTEEESNFLAKVNLDMKSELTRENVVGLFTQLGYGELQNQLDSKGAAAHIQNEINLKGTVQARLVANYLLIQKRGLEIGQKLASEFGEAKMPEHIGKFFKFRVDKVDDRQTIGFLFGLLQDVVEKYGITQYSASQTSLTQIFQTLARQAEYGLSGSQDVMVIKPGNVIQSRQQSSKILFI